MNNIHIYTQFYKKAHNIGSQPRSLAFVEAFNFHYLTVYNFII